MATSGEKAQPYSEVVERLEDVVKKLETGQLSLEDTLAEFEKGIRLVQRGEELLAQADKRVQELLEHEGQERVVPLETKAPPGRLAGPAGEDEDIPF
ncbi:MAG: exodeoxyribonuclease VII small subunit [Myxococcaceae bacterium]